MSKKLLTVFGATGNQGGAVITTVLGHSKLSEQFSLRAITRNTESPKAKSLGSKGVDLAVGDLNDPESLKAALKGSYAVFAVTNYWETMSSPTEVKQGKNIADACVAVGVKHVVWSALPNVTKLTGGKLKAVEHFDGKSEIADYFEEVKKSAGMLATYFMPGFYMSNIKSMTKANPQVNDGTPTLTLPWDPENTQVPLFDAAKDTGTFVGAIIGATNPAELDGKYIQAVSQWGTPSQIVSTVSKVIGREVKFNPVPEDVFVKFPLGPAAEELTENMVLIRDYSYYGKGADKNQAESDKILEPVGLKTESFEDFVKKSGTWDFK